MRGPVGFSQAGEPHPGDRRERCILERPVGDELQPPEEGGREVQPQRGGQVRVHLVRGRTLRLLRRGFHDGVAGVGGENDERIGEVRLEPFGILHPALVEHLVEHLDDVAVGLLDLVEEHHAVGGSPGSPR